MTMEIPFSVSLDEALRTADGIPAWPRLLGELHALLADSNSGPDQIASLLRRDGGLTAGIVRMVNSVAFSRGNTVGTLDEALLRVGFQQVFELVALANAVHTMTTPLNFYQVTVKDLREHALMLALLMEQLSDLLWRDVRLAYTTGLLCPMGKIALELADRRAARPGVAAPTPDASDIIGWERSVFGVTSPSVAALVLKAWRFPPELCITVRDHSIAGVVIDPIPEAKLLHVACAQADAMGYGLACEKGLWALPRR
jgi:HD-like signal output (HDOD) protein